MLDGDKDHKKDIEKCIHNQELSENLRLILLI